MYHKTNRIIVATAIAVWTFNSPLKAELQSLSFLSSNSVDVSSSEKNIPFAYTASESITHIQLYFRQETPTGFGRIYGWTGSGTKIQVPKFTKPGKWIIEQIDYYPEYGNPTTYARNPFAIYGSWLGGADPKPLPAGMQQLEILVANAVTDDAAPTLIDFKVDMEQLRFTSQGSLYAPCTIMVEDNLSGFDSADISFGEVTVGFNSYFKADGSTNVYEGKLYFWNAEVNKIYNFDSALVKDQTGNALHISSSGQPYSDGYYQINSSPVTGTPFDNLAIQLPETFADLPIDSDYYSVSSSDDSSKRFKKAKKTKANKPSKKKPGSAKKATSKKSGSKKKPAAKKAKKK